MQDVTQQPEITQPEIIETPTSPEIVFTKSCKGECGLDKPLEDFQLVPSKAGGHLDKRYDICRDCISKRRAASQVKNRAAKNQEKRFSEIGAEAAKHKATEPPAWAIASRLVEIAAEIHDLATPPELKTLAEAVRDVMLDAVEGHGVYMIRGTQYEALETAFNSIKNRILWDER